MSLKLTCTKMKTYPNPVMTQHIRGHSRKPSTVQVQDGAETLASPTLMPKDKTVVCSPLPHKWSIIVCLERPSGKNRITEELVHRFASHVNLLVPTWHKSPPEVICKSYFSMEIIKTPQRHPNIWITARHFILLRLNPSASCWLGGMVLDHFVS